MTYSSGTLDSNSSANGTIGLQTWSLSLGSIYNPVPGLALQTLVVQFNLTAQPNLNVPSLTNVTQYATVNWTNGLPLEANIALPEFSLQVYLL